MAAGEVGDGGCERSGALGCRWGDVVGEGAHRELGVGQCPVERDAQVERDDLVAIAGEDEGGVADRGDAVG